MCVYAYEVVFTKRRYYMWKDNIKVNLGKADIEVQSEF